MSGRSDAARSQPTSLILPCDVLDGLRALDDESVQTVVTSPPYYSLRDYQLPPSIWGGEAGCKHEWGVALKSKAQRQRNGAEGGLHTGRAANKLAEIVQTEHQQGTFCVHCGAWRGCLGLEPTPDLFVAHLVGVFREVRRVLRDDGTVWLNLGDSYNAAGRTGHGTRIGVKQGTNRASAVGADSPRPASPDLKPKDLLMMPARVALALQADGWYLRMDIVWAKGLSFCPTYAGSVMPESVTDRPTKTHEYIFLLTKKERYWYDAEAVKEKGTFPAGTRAAKGSDTREGNRRPATTAIYDGKRHLRSVWAIGTKPFKGCHFATFPPALVVPCLTAGTPPASCSACGQPYTHTVIKSDVPPEIKAQFEAARTASADRTGREDGHTARKPNHVRAVILDTYEPGCTCGAPPAPALVLDPFSGAGTVGVVVKQMGRSFLGLELNPEYVALAERRIEQTAGPDGEA